MTAVVSLDDPAVRKLLGVVERPGRYVGGEFGAISKSPDPGEYTVCVAFPDLYEIGMSNQAVRILYRVFNEIDGVRAERAFSPAPDFREGLRRLGLPLFSLENRVPIIDFDVLALTVGFELAFTNVLTFMDASGIPIEKRDRSDEHPLVIAGGPAMTNPTPWMRYLDGVFIGEAEGSVSDLVSSLKGLKADGAVRAERIAVLAAADSIHTGAETMTARAVWNGFGTETGPPAALPVPSLVTAQDHGVIEIMRGCPNKCRFCHAGVFYRPFRQKPAGRILEEADFLVNECGYRDITLSSLSTGDYSGLDHLVESLNRIYAPRNVSFSLPSLRVNSVTLSLIGRLGTVRKSGLTFAVETPAAAGQRGINKEVPSDRVIEILLEAKREGWKLAKFYFMLGLPVAGNGAEEEGIVDYLIGVQRATGMNLNVNLGTFIPKPHTPFERSGQLTDAEAMKRIKVIRDGLRPNKRIKLSFHSPFVSFLEGILSRGDDRAGVLAEAAWRKGAEFDAWDDRMDKEAWRAAIEEADWDVESEICRAKEKDESLPWDGISLGVTSRHLKIEAERAVSGSLTPPCGDPCRDHCGVCGKDCKVVYPGDAVISEEILGEGGCEGERRRLLMAFRKFGPAVYLGHLDMMSVFERSFQRAGVDIDFTRGFNPKPRIEFAQPLPLGVFSDREILTVIAPYRPEGASEVVERLNEALPSGLEAIDAGWLAPVPEGRKTVKVMSAFWGSDWRLTPDCIEPYPAHGRLAESLERESGERGIPGDITIAGADGDGLAIRLRHGGTRHHNFVRLLEAAMGMPPLASDWVITRSRCLAKDAEGNPVDYRTAFPEHEQRESV